MSQYVQLLGSDTPNGYGGCCFYGPLDHPALHEDTAGTNSGLHRTDAVADSIGSTLHALSAAVPDAPSALLKTADASASATAASTTLAPPTSQSEAAASSRHRTEGSTAAAEKTATPWNWSSYLTARRPTWPRTGPLHADSVLHPTSTGTGGATTAAGASAALPGSTAPRVTADTGSSGSEGYIFFNCPEGSQRFSSEANIKLKKVRGFFFTRWSAWHGRSGGAGTVHSREACYGGAGAADAEGVGAASAVMGLPGMLFTINDAGARHATFFGPSAVLDQDSEHPHRDPAEGTPRMHSSAAVVPRAGSSESSRASASASAGLRGFLSALRFHYFQYRPMVFRQLHGAVPCRADECVDADGACSTHDASATTAAALAALGNNQLHFVETVAECDAHGAEDGGRDEAVPSAVGAAPFVHLILPLSPHSLLIAFRVSSGRRGAHTPTPHAAEHPTSAASEAQLQQSHATFFVASDGISATPHGGSAAPHATAAAAGSDAAPPTSAPRAFRAPCSPDAVFGYAVVVAPGASFDAARARALGIKPGPKYGQLKQGIPVEADAEEGAADQGNARRAVSQEGDCGEGAPAQEATPQRRVVHPSDVMRATPATRHAYVSLVLDGDAPAEVQTALTRLLGRSDAASASASATASAALTVGDFSTGSIMDGMDARGHTVTPPDRRGGVGEEGVLVRLLRTRFPHLAYFYDDEVEPMESGAEGARWEVTRGWRRRPRQLCVRHVVHVQPASYFHRFQERHGGGAIDSAGVYAAYNAFVFAHVACDAHPAASASSVGCHASGNAAAVGVSLTPSLSFTLSDLADGDGPSAAATGAPVPGTRSSTPTWHLFTSFVQRHFTAFPTALVHRYHLHHLAPSLFPVQLRDETRAASHAGGVPEVEYWPYSLKLRCVPEAALQLPRQPTAAAATAAATASKTSAVAPHAGKSTSATITAPASRSAALPLHTSASSATASVDVSTRAGHTAVAQSTAAPTAGGGKPTFTATAAAAPPPAISATPTAARKRDRQGESPAAAAAPHTTGSQPPPAPPASTSATAASVEKRTPASATPPRHLCVADGLAALLPYPTRASALALLSSSFRRSLTSPSAAPPTDTVASPQPTRHSAGSTEQDAGGGLLGFLGTGSAVPSKYRNVSGTFLELHLPAYCFPPAASIGGTTDDPVDAVDAGLRSGGQAGERRATASAPVSTKGAAPPWRRGVVILDCGEGSLGQLASLCGPVRCGVRGAAAAARCGDGDAATRVLPIGGAAIGVGGSGASPAAGDVDEAQLRQFVLDVVLVFISHAHADHHLGLLSLLTLRHRYLSPRGPGAGKSSRPPLLVVCPTEVYAFIVDTWGTTAPYATWLHEDCVFELMPPPVGVFTAHAVPDGADTQEAEQADVPACRHLSHTTAHAHDGHVHGENSAGQHPQQQHVVPMPRLQAHLAAWNGAIASALQKAERACVAPCDDDAALRQHQPPPLSNTARPHPVWWDAEVITVDHPANAHALLLRFPYCTPARLSQLPDTDAHQTVDGGRGGGGWNGPCASPHAMPDTSRVLLFSGDTRPSSFLVERSRVFAAPHATHASTDALRTSTRLACTSPASASSSPRAAVAPVFILLHEATFGPGFEGEAIRKKHSTLPEALQVGAAVGAEFVVLNHFSQRYPKLPGLSEEQLGGKSADLVCQRKARPTTEHSVEEEQRSAEAEAHSPNARVTAATATTSEGTIPRTTGDADAAVDGSTGVSSSGREAAYANMSFAFDLMAVSFTDMHRGLVPRLTPTLVRLLEEYDSWGLSTTRRMRSGGKDGGAGSSGGAGGKPPQRHSTASPGQPAVAAKAQKWKVPKTQ